MLEHFFKHGEREFRSKIKPIIRELERYNEDEVFYKNAFALRSDKKAYDKYISGFSADYLKEKDIRLFGDISVYRLEEDYIFKGHEKQNVVLRKHQRYTPPFLHFHDYFEIFFVLSGHCENKINGNVFVHTAGTIVFIAPFVRHTISVFDDSIILNVCIRKTTFEKIFFNLLTQGDFISDFFLGNIYPDNPLQHLVFDMIDNRILEMIFSMLIEQSISDDYSCRIIDNLASVFFALVLRKNTSPAFDAGRHAASRFISYINNNYRNVTLKSAAKYFGFSPEHCSRLIKLQTGKSFTGLLMEIRMQKARDLLSKTNTKVYDIAHTLGYENQETFIRNFKKQHGVSPSAYRNNSAE